MSCVIVSLCHVSCVVCHVSCAQASALQGQARAETTKGEHSDELDKLEVFTQQSLMSYNQQKTNLLLFSRMKKFNFTPEFQLGGQEIKIVELKKKLLGAS